jgi:hypothetical protein
LPDKKKRLSLQSLLEKPPPKGVESEAQDVDLQCEIDQKRDFHGQHLKKDL